MISIPKSSALSATAYIVPNLLKPHLPASSTVLQSILVEKRGQQFLKVPKSATAVTNSLSASSNVRLAHTDIKYPDFSKYRRESRLDPTKKRDPIDGETTYMYIMGGVSFMAATFYGKYLVETIVTQLSPTAAVQALSKTEVAMSDIPEGKNMIFKWRGKPLFIRHRTASEISQEKDVNLMELRDPQHDDDRVREDKWLVIIGICTHLGCIPLADQGNHAGGYYCPCHGSHYDASGRIRKGPAPLNLEVPPYEMNGDLIIVG